MRVRHLLACTTLVGGVLVAPPASAAHPHFMQDLCDVAAQQAD